MSYGYGYDSVEGRALCGAITSIMTGEAYAESARMAAAMGRSRAIVTRGRAVCRSRSQRTTFPRCST
jgi:ribonucleoside-diphosphate reductase alpha chain